MARQLVDVGVNPGDGTGDNLRNAFIKVNDNFIEVYTELGGDSLSSLSFTRNTISSDDPDTNIIIDPNGTGYTDIQGDIQVTGNLTVAVSNEVFLNLPTSAGSVGSLWNDSGTVKVST